MHLRHASFRSISMAVLFTSVIHFPGELVLTLHWSLINYSAIVKILKKHDKRTGVLLRAPYLANVLQQVCICIGLLSDIGHWIVNERLLVY